jgi:hypothetical protein
MRRPEKLRDEARRLLLEAKSTVEDERRRSLLARALTLATAAEMAERKLGSGPVAERPASPTSAVW